MSEKKKNAVNRLGTIPFTVLWTLAYGLGWATVIFGGIMTSRYLPEVFTWFPDVVYIMLAVGVPAFIYSISQQLLIRWKFAIHFRWWFVLTTLAAVLAGGSFQILEWVNMPNIPINNPIVIVTIIFSYIFGVQAVAQAWQLRKHVKKAWLWVAAAIASAATFGVPLVNSDFFSEWATMGAFGFAGLLQGAVMALTLVWLFGMTRVEPLKRGMDAAQMKQAEANLAYTDNQEAVSELPQEQAMRLRQ